MKKVQRGPFRRPVQHQICMGDLYTAHVVELVGLPESRITGGAWRSLDQCQTITDCSIDLFPPLCEFLRRKVRREERDPLLCEKKHGKSDQECGLKETLHKTSLEMKNYRPERRLKKNPATPTASCSPLQCQTQPARPPHRQVSHRHVRQDLH